MLILMTWFGVILASVGLVVTVFGWFKMDRATYDAPAHIALLVLFSGAVTSLIGVILMLLGGAF